MGKLLPREEGREGFLAGFTRPQRLEMTRPGALESKKILYRRFENQHSLSPLRGRGEVRG
jgi:hypothetical protein